MDTRLEFDAAKNLLNTSGIWLINFAPFEGTLRNAISRIYENSNSAGQISRVVSNGNSKALGDGFNEIIEAEIVERLWKEVINKPA